MSRSAWLVSCAVQGLTTSAAPVRIYGRGFFGLSQIEPGIIVEIGNVRVNKRFEMPLNALDCARHVRITH